MRTFCNLDLQILVEQPAVTQAVAYLREPKSNTSSLTVQFVRSGAVVDPDPSYTSGSLTPGQYYKVITYVAGDNFANVADSGSAANADDAHFLCGGTTPTTWTHGSTLKRCASDGTLFGLRWTVKEDGNFTQDPSSAFLIDFSKTGSGTTTAYTGQVNYNTTSLNTLLSANPDALLMVELSWSGADADKANWVTLYLRNDLYKDGQGVPVSGETEYVKSVNGMSGVVTVSGVDSDDTLTASHTWTNTGHTLNIPGGNVQLSSVANFVTLDDAYGAPVERLADGALFIADGDDSATGGFISSYAGALSIISGLGATIDLSTSAIGSGWAAQDFLISNNASVVPALAANGTATLIFDAGAKCSDGTSPLRGYVTYQAQPDNSAKHSAIWLSIGRYLSGTGGNQTVDGGGTNGTAQFAMEASYDAGTGGIVTEAHVTLNGNRVWFMNVKDSDNQYGVASLNIPFDVGVPITSTFDQRGSAISVFSAFRSTNATAEVMIRNNNYATDASSCMISLVGLGTGNSIVSPKTYWSIATDIAANGVTTNGTNRLSFINRITSTEAFGIANNNSATFAGPVTIPVTASLILGATSALGQLCLKGSTSGTATIQPQATAGTPTITLPNASSTLPVFGQQITFTGPSAARTIALPNTDFTAARSDASQTFTGTQTVDVLNLPATTSSVGQITQGGVPIFHTFSRGNNSPGNLFIGTGTAAGNLTLTGNTLGNNIGLGSGVMNNLSTGYYNVAIGGSAGAALTTGINNLAIGTAALSSMATSGQSVAVGTNALTSAVLGANVGIGYNAGNGLTSGQQNTLIGYSVATGTITGNYSVVIGGSAAQSMTGSSNVVIGSGATPCFSTLTSGTFNTALGDGCVIGSATGTYRTAIGAGATCTADNQVMLGRSSEAVVVPGTLSVGSGTPVLKILSATATLNFPSTVLASSSDLTITVTGAAVGDCVWLGVPNGSVNANSDFFAWVSATNTVTVRFSNYSALSIDPASGTFRVAVIQF